MIEVIQKEDIRDRLERIALAFEPRIANSLLDVFEQIRSELVLKEVEEILLRGGISAVMGLISNLEDYISAAIRSEIVDAVSQSGRIAIHLLPEGSAKATYVFNILDPNTISELNNHNARLVSYISQSTRQAVQQSLEANIIAGNNPIKTARDFRDSIGLTDIQEQAVRNFRAGLESGSSTPLQRELRDRRFDRSIQRAIASGESIPADKVDKMVERYRQRMINFRAQTIARTESIRAINMGEFESLRQAEESGELIVKYTRHWVFTHDDRTRYSHRGIPVLNPNGRSIHEYFITPLGNRLRFPGDPNAPAEEVVNCRCTTYITVL
jgi:hypothetical protein